MSAGAEWADGPQAAEEEADEDEEVIDEIMTAGARRVSTHTHRHTHTHTHTHTHAHTHTHTHAHLNPKP